MMKRTLRWGLALCLLLAVTAYAAPAASAAAPVAPCTGDHSDWTAINSLADFTANDGQKYYTLSAGNYYLNAPITVTNGYKFYLGSGVTLCLNGKTLSGSGTAYTDNVFIHAVGSNSNPLRICDCHTEAPGKIINSVSQTYTINIGSSGTCELWGVDIVDSYGRIGVVYVPTGNTLKMYGGTISGGTGLWSAVGGVSVSGGTFYMYGGTIENNKIGSVTNNVNVASGTFYYYGGTIPGGAVGTITYPVTVNSSVLTATVTNSDDPTTVSGTNCSYDVPTGTLTLTGDPTSVAFQPMTLEPVIKLGADVTTAAFDTVSSGKSLIIDLNGHTLTGSAAEMSVNGTFTLMDGTGDNGILNTRVAVNSAGTFHFNSGKITNTHNASWKAGGIHSAGTVVMNGGVITGCTTTGNAGGVRVDGGSFTMNGGAITGNTVGSGNTVGGGVYYTNGTFTMNGGVITGTAAYGGGVNVNGSGLTFTMTGGEITGCSAAGDTAKRGGAGVYLTGSGTSMVMSGGAIHDNTSESTGGGVTLAGGASLTMSGTAAIRDNEADTYGGAVYAPSGTTFTMQGGTIEHNSANNGGAVTTEGGSFQLQGGTISGNSASSYAGAVCMRAGGTFTMTGGTITGNSGNYGAVMMWTGAPTATISGGAITANRSSASWAGGITQMKGTLTVSGTASVQGNYRDTTAVLSDIIVMGDTASMTMSGGTVDLLSFVGAGEGTTITGSITGGTVASYLDAYSAGTVSVEVRGGKIAGMGGAANSYIKVYGGSFGSTTNLLHNAAEPGMTVVPSGVEGYPYALGLAVAPLANMRLDEALTFYVYVPVASAVWTVNGAVRTPDSVTATVGGNAVSASMTTAGDYYKVEIPVFAKQMTDTVSVSFLDGEGKEIRTVTDSVKDYAVRILADPTDAGEATLMTDMLNYGAAAQIYFGYKTDVLATAGVSLGTPSSVSLAVAPAATIHTAAFHSSNLTLEERIDFSMYFWSARVSDGASYSYVVTAGVGGAEVASGSGTFAALDTNGVLVEAKIAGLDLSAMESAVISVTYTDERDSAVLTATDSMANYLARNNGLDIDDAPSSYAEDGTLISAAGGNDTSDLYAKVLAFAHAANVYSYGTQA